MQLIVGHFAAEYFIGVREIDWYTHIGYTYSAVALFDFNILHFII